MSLLCVGIDHRYVKACLCAPVSGQWRLLAWLREQAPAAMTDDLQIEVEPTLVTSKVHWAAATLGRFLDHDLLPRPHPAADEPPPAAAFAVDRILLTVSPLPPTRVWAMALTPLWLSPLEDLIQSVEAHLVGATICDHRMNSLLGSRDLALAAPDLIVVCGGYDIEAATPPALDAIARVLADSMQENGPLPVMYAGRGPAAGEFARILQTRIANLELTVVDNIAPQPDRFQGDALHGALLAFRARAAQSALREEDIQTWRPPEAGWGSHSVNFMRMLQLWQARHRPATPVHGVHYSGGNRVHVLLEDADSVRIAHASSLHRPDAVRPWPAPLVTSGQTAFPSDAARDSVHDPHGFLPLLAPLYDIEPAAVWSILAQDVLVPGPRPPA